MEKGLELFTPVTAVPEAGVVGEDDPLSPPPQPDKARITNETAIDRAVDETGAMMFLAKSSGSVWQASRAMGHGGGHRVQNPCGNGLFQKATEGTRRCRDYKVIGQIT